MPVVSVPHNSSNRLLLRNQDKGCTPSVAHSLPLPLGPALLNLSIMVVYSCIDCQDTATLKFGLELAKTNDICGFLLCDYVLDKGMIFFSEFEKS